jgi:hypothetical protein
VQRDDRPASTFAEEIARIVEAKGRGVSGDDSAAFVKTSEGFTHGRADTMERPRSSDATVAPGEAVAEAVERGGRGGRENEVEVL